MNCFLSYVVGGVNVNRLKGKALFIWEAVLCHADLCSHNLELIWGPWHKPLIEEKSSHLCSLAFLPAHSQVPGRNLTEPDGVLLPLKTPRPRALLSEWESTSVLSQDDWPTGHRAPKLGREPMRRGLFDQRRVFHVEGALGVLRGLSIYLHSSPGHLFLK